MSHQIAVCNTQCVHRELSTHKSTSALRARNRMLRKLLHFLLDPFDEQARTR